MPGLVFGDGFVDLFNDGLAVPLRGAPVPVVEADLAAKMQHERLKGGGRVELKTNSMKLGLGG